MSIATSPTGCPTRRFMVKTNLRNWICEEANSAAEAVAQFREVFDARKGEKDPEAAPMEPLEGTQATAEVPSSTGDPDAGGLLAGEPGPVESLATPVAVEPAPEPEVPSDPGETDADEILAESGMAEKLVELLDANGITLRSEVPTTVDELIALDGIGEAYAKDILAFLAGGDSQEE